jgi:hypothetical protein
MKRIIKTGLIAVMALQSLGTSAQEKEFSQISKEDVLSDFKLAVDILKKQHPNPYKFTDSITFDRQVDSLLKLAAKQKDALSCLQFSPVQLLRDVHTSFSFSPEHIRDVYNHVQFFPFPVVIERGRIFTNLKGGEVPFGAEVMSINGLSVPEILKVLSSSSYSDGYIKTGTDRIYEEFQLLFSLRAGLNRSFEIVYKSPESNKENKVVIPYAGPTQAFHSARKGVLPVNMLQRAYYVYRNYEDATKTGVLTVNTFALDEATAYKEFSEFFKEVNRREYKQVVIDIRSNGGGNPAISALLYSFLAKAPFRNVYNYRTKTIEIAYPEYAVGDNGRLLSEDDIRRNLNFLYQRFDKDSSGFFVGNARLKDGLLEDFPADKDAFKGEVYVLVGGGTVSAATYFASLVQKNKRGEIVGKETGSGVDATTAAWFLKYMLPKTKSILTVPMSELYFFNASKDSGHGVLPDYEVPLNQFISYIRASKDPELTYVFERIKTKSDLAKK